MRIFVTFTLLFVIAGTLGCKGRSPNGKNVKRVVSLTPSATELVVAVGGIDLLVGVDRYSVHPARVKALPKVGDFMHPSFEAVLSLKPDLVVLDEVQRQLVAKLRSAGIRSVVLRMHTIDDVRTGLREVGEAIHHPAQAAAAVRALSEDVANIRAKVAKHTGPRPQVLMIIGREVGTLKTMVAAGPGSFLDELLGLLGATNTLASSPLRYPKISIEQVMRGRPDVILDAVRPHQVAAAKADWAALERVPAVKNGRIYPLTDQIFMSPGPRVGQALSALARLLYPDL